MEQPINELLDWYANEKRHLTAIDVMDKAYRLKDEQVNQMAKLLQWTSRAMYNLSDESAIEIVNSFYSEHKKFK